MRLYTFAVLTPPNLGNIRDLGRQGKPDVLFPCCGQLQEWVATGNNGDEPLILRFCFDRKKQSCGPVVKMRQLRLRSSFHEHGSGSSSGALAYNECAPVHTHYNFDCHVVPHFEGKTNLIKYTKLRVYTRSHHEEISENATITDSDDSGTVTSRNVQLKITVT